MPEGIDIREMVADDYDEAIALWHAADGVGVSDVDSREGVVAYLARNPGSSLVAEAGGRIVGTLLSGNDGRRGYLHHLAVAEAHKGRGIGTSLLREGLRRLKAAGFTRCHCFVFRENEAAQHFYAARGWRMRDDLVVMTADLDADA